MNDYEKSQHKAQEFNSQEFKKEDIPQNRFNYKIQQQGVNMKNDLVKQATDYNQQLNERLDRIEHNQVLIAQTIHRIAELMVEHLDRGDKQINFYSKSLIELIADLTPTSTNENKK